jgi:hypothetical protein
MYSVLNCHNVAKHTEFNLGLLRFNVASSANAGVSKKFYNGIPNAAMWQVLQKRLHLRTNCPSFNVTQPHSNIWSIIVKLFFEALCMCV